MEIIIDEQLINIFKQYEQESISLYKLFIDDLWNFDKGYDPAVECVALSVGDVILNLNSNLSLSFSSKSGYGVSLCTIDYNDFKQYDPKFNILLLNDNFFNEMLTNRIIDVATYYTRGKLIADLTDDIENYITSLANSGMPLSNLYPIIYGDYADEPAMMNMLKDTTIEQVTTIWDYSSKDRRTCKIYYKLPHSVFTSNTIEVDITPASCFNAMAIIEKTLK